MKTCPKCKQTMEADGFRKDASRKDGLSFYCSNVAMPTQKPCEGNTRSLTHLSWATANQSGRCVRKRIGSG